MYYLAFDIGGSAIKYAVLTEAGGIDHRGSLPADLADHEEFVEALGRVFDAAPVPIEGIALSSCGELDPVSGHMFTGGAFRYNAGTNLAGDLQARCGVPTSIENDANCALLAEAHDGALDGVRNGAVLVIGTGIGGALLLGGRLHHGAHFLAGGASWTKVDLRETSETQFSDLNGVPGLVRQYAGAIGADPGTVDAHEVFRQVELGSGPARDALERFTGRLAVFVFNLHVLLDLEVVAIGGGISAQPALLRSLVDGVDRVFTATRTALPRPAVLPCVHRNDANLLGALWHHRAEPRY